MILTGTIAPVQDGHPAPPGPPVGAPLRPRRRPLVWVSALGIVILGATAWFSWSLPATASRRARPSAGLAERNVAWRWMLDHAGPPGSPNLLAATLAAVTVAFFVAWLGVVALTWHRSGRSTVRVVLALTAAAAIISALALPNQTSDVYDYALFGRVVAVHGGQAYRDVPDQFPDDPVYRFASHQYTGRPDNKLPVWTATAVGVAELAGDSPVANLLAFRFLLAGATVATAGLVAFILHRIRPGAAASGAAIFGLNPITVVYGTSKTDALMALLLVAGIALVVVGRHYLATAVVTLSVLVKLITVPALVLVVAMPLPRGRSPLHPAGRKRRDGAGPLPRFASVRSVGGRAAVALLVGAAIYGPLPDPVGLARDHLAGGDHATVVPAIHPIAVAAFALALVVVAAATWRRHPETDVERVQGLVIRAAVFLVVFAAFLTRPGLPWYLISALAVVALARSIALLGVLTTLSAVSFLMGWWDAVGTRDHPLPPLVPHRPVAYLGAVALAAVVVAVRAARVRAGNATAARNDVQMGVNDLPWSWRPGRDRRGTGR